MSPRPGEPRPRGAHLVGSVPLSNSTEVFRTVGSILGHHLRRMPDGETGRRLRWNSWTAPSYERAPGLELVQPPPGNYTPWKQVRLTIDPDRLVLPRLGFADAAVASYAEFARLRTTGVVPEWCRFQVCLPSPVAPMIVLVEEGSRAAVEPAHLRRLFTELDEILSVIPHDQLAVQWDVCQDVGIWEGYYPAYFDDPREGVIERLAACAARVPEPVELGFHLCYGDYGHRHFMAPRDLAVVTEMANRLRAAIARRIDWVHVPVPADRDDEAYFRPLEGLGLDPETELYLGLLHEEDGVEGAWRRIRAARGFVRDFGVATECGLGRRPREVVEPLLHLHAQVADPVA
jgi:methionine synthase II (cobalamin-independent)